MPSSDAWFPPDSFGSAASAGTRAALRALPELVAQLEARVRDLESQLAESGGGGGGGGGGSGGPSTGQPSRVVKSKE